MSSLEIGKLLRAGSAGFVAGCRLSQLEAPALGALVKAALTADYEVYGIITGIGIDDDGIVRQLVTVDTVSPAIIADNRTNRNVPVEISVLAVGFKQSGRISHLLPPRPPLSLDSILLCDDAETAAFTSAGRFGYLRHILQAEDLPAGDVLAAHLHQAAAAHVKTGDPGWLDKACRELITLLRDDYGTLMNVLSALADIPAFRRQP